MTALRPTMAALIRRTRLLINDAPTPGDTQVFLDQDIQDVLDETREDVRNGTLHTRPTFSGSTVQYLDYWSDYGGWEDGAVLKQYLTVVVTPSLSEPIAGHWQFAASTLPPVYITGSLFDIYGAAADLLERWAARWVQQYSFVAGGGISFTRGQTYRALLNLAKTLRYRQRPTMLYPTRQDIAGAGTHQQQQHTGSVLGPRNIDYFSSGDGR